MNHSKDDYKRYPFIITLTGPSMSGKSYVMKKIEEQEFILKNENITFIPERVTKYTTRPYRLEEIHNRQINGSIDVKSVDVIPNDCDLVYRTYGQDYGVKVSKLQRILDSNKCPVIVVNDVRVIEEIKSIFKGKVLSLFLFRKIPQIKDFEKISNERGNVKEDEAKKRYEKAISIYRTYIENISLFDRVILNVKDYSGKVNEIDYTEKQIHNILKAVIFKRIDLNKEVQKKSKKLFIISGSAASGKDEIIRAVGTLGKMQAFILPKYTTRSQEPEDGDEMICQFVPKSNLLNEYKIKYDNKRSEIENLTCPDETFINYSRNLFNQSKRDENFDDFLCVNWEAEKLKRQRNILNPLQEFWAHIEAEKINLIKKGYSSNEIKSIINKEFFEKNKLYIDLEKIYDLNKNDIERKIINQIPGVTGPAFFINHEGIGYVFYVNNNDIKYAFEIQRNNEDEKKSIFSQMVLENKHCIIAASLTEIFNICREKIGNNVVTVFAYSQISAEEYKNKSKEETVIAKANAFSKDLERYSEYIEYFDHVSIYAESVLGDNRGGAEEELIDQIFRLFREYN